MQAFAERYSTSGPLAELKRAQKVVDDDDEVSDAMWGSNGGFGAISNGTHSFVVPSVPDVSLSDPPTKFCILR
jgi:20S proteasome subunit beta 5